ncbi:Uncharacterised protein [Mycobacteroides abscessus]|nr:Uncharacterised protein [Mycobacteroides abscessus]
MIRLSPPINPGISRSVICGGAVLAEPPLPTILGLLDSVYTETFHALT